MNDDKKHFDVARAADIPPSHTSRPVIVGREPGVRDPMVREQGESDQEMSLSHHAEATLTPPTLTADKVATEQEKEDEKKAKDPSEKNRVADIDKDNAKLEQLIKDKTYALPIHGFKSSKTWLFIVFGVVVLILSAAAYYFYASR